MTKKDFEAIAAVFSANIKSLVDLGVERKGAGDDALRMWMRLRDDLATVFADSNPNFDYCRFKVACMLPKEPSK